MTSSESFVIAAQTVLGVDTASITFSALSTRYNQYFIVVVGRSSAAANTDTLIIQINANTTAYVNSMLFVTASATVTASASNTPTSITVGSIPANTATAGAAGAAMVAFLSSTGTSDRNIGMTDFASSWINTSTDLELRNGMTYLTLNNNSLDSIKI